MDELSRDPEPIWLELLDARGTVIGRQRLGTAPVVIGRGYGSDLIVDDPQVCPAHLQVRAQGDGSVEVRDLGSVNGLWNEQDERLFNDAGRSGSVYRVGQTTVRLRGASHPVPATEPAEPASARADRSHVPVRTAFGLAAAAVLVLSLGGYLDGYVRVDAAEQVGEGLSLALVLGAYAGLWAFVSRVTAHRFSYTAHLAIASGAMLVFAAWSVVTEYATFALPDSGAIEAVSGLAALTLGVLVLDRHLAFASGFRRRTRRALASVVVLGLMGVAVVSDWEEDFSSVPDFSAVVKPVGVGLVRTTTAAEFVESAADLAAEVDELAADVAP